MFIAGTKSTSLNAILASLNNKSVNWGSICVILQTRARSTSMRPESLNLCRKLEKINNLLIPSILAWVCSRSLPSVLFNCHQNNLQNRHKSKEPKTEKEDRYSKFLSDASSNSNPRVHHRIEARANRAATTSLGLLRCQAVRTPQWRHTTAAWTSLIDVCYNSNNFCY